MVVASDEYEDAIHVLHVDDDEDFAELTATFLENEDGRLTVETAPNASEGLTRLADTTFDCVVSDYEMPDQNGIEFLETVRDTNPNLPFILFTGKGSETVAGEAISAGVTDYLQKETGTDQYTILANRITNAVAANRMNAEVTRARQRLEQILETVPECIVELNPEGEFIFANERAADVLGLERSEVIGRTYNDPEWDIRDPDGNPLPDAELPFQQVRDSGEPLQGYRHAIRWPNGTKKILRVDGAPLYDDEGEVESAVFALSDITDDWERETRLERTTARLRALFERSPDMLGVHDSDGTILDVNPRLCEKTGYSEDELVGMKIWELDETIAPEETRTALARMSVGERRELDTVFRHSDGSTFPVEVHIRRIELDDTDRFVVISRDITDRQQRERELEQRTDELERMTANLEEQYRYLFEEAPVMAVETRAEDGAPIVEDCNQLFAEKLGYDKADILERPLAEFYAADSQRQLLNESGYEQALTGDFTRENRELVAANGAVLETLLRAVPRYDLDGEVIGTIAFYIDISEQKDLKRRNERLDEFASVVSHDLRNPLNVAAGRLELARVECDSEHFAAIDTAHDRMQTLIDDLLTLARQDEATDVEPVSLPTVTEDCWQTVATIDATLAVETERTIRADRSRLQQLFENLFRNAIEHGGADVTVTVGELSETNGFYVEDDGPGIPVEDRKQVFEAGYSTNDEGTGFGLRIVREIVEAHGWNIRITDGPDGGARFEITES